MRIEKLKNVYININMPPRRKVIMEKEPKRKVIVEKEPKRKVIMEKEEAPKYIKAPKLVVSKKNGQYKIFASIPEDKKMIELKY